jgi:hypothetical protein
MVGVLAAAPIGIVDAAPRVVALPRAAAVACDIAPRPVAEMIALLGAVELASPPAPTPLPPGRPADAGTVADAAAVAREMEEHINAGDEHRLLSLSSDTVFQSMPNMPDMAAPLEAMAAASQRFAVVVWQERRLLRPVVRRTTIRDPTTRIRRWPIGRRTQRPYQPRRRHAELVEASRSVRMNDEMPRLRSA